MRQCESIAVIAGMMALGGMQSSRGIAPHSRRSPEQNEAAKLDRKKKKQHRQNRKRGRR